MNTDRKTRSAFIRAYLCASVAHLLLLGCAGKPSQVNIELRKKIHELETQAANLQRAREADAATIRALQQERGTLPTLPQDRLDELFTVAGLRFGRLTGNVDNVLKVYIVPTDQNGDPIKAAGSFVIDAFDLSMPGDNRLGHWEFPLAEAKKRWTGELLLYTYEFACPWERTPESADVTVRVTFQDALTGRQVSSQKVLSITPAPATAPAD
jgi:hypothetical protein